MILPDIEQTCTELGERLATYLEQNNLDQPLLVGIRTGGVWVADRLQQKLQTEDGVASLDISFYRDDFTRHGLHPQVMGSELPDSIEDRHIVLIDDVIMSGRTIRAAMNELFDYGRPASITLISLLDIGRRELPIQPDLTGARLELEEGQLVKLSGPTPMTLTLA
ncbi:MAG: bifunctional pyr operon transcriptional regulator/uracil phosphoribosyltransferase [Oceanospirillaceae bacterium]|uniref:bifunctional pyr operon transcriptional regulator/uracil phosphoribosyltransferase PyrR n=1 Tax=unclassified Thalassolituus TaxID=2624967 RepID=UPI000C59ADED|nr:MULTISPECIES: bifunctional pyr operon transcriptional regulator/uracil phosphoribosyltransferase PyrR [unclassified Thalassolituus]MAS26206.1 bifunctional pyr operon transcriptional regulator/uracil phosphoribosyltransferase [Oceanospirillaceae bacterium]MAX98911.1 bifunctional pyr operon transcriptional regulator/uracil phosphoribosyltransferase [Oceanospirillaceae bacterium]MBL33318.1 bifunctional pyr operon transcriptional regulator/uracil phosphoribosyltransferase [Oceanospirillaceae bact|tara:strand:- start:5398 stop:5892 length:495 start_codon:yes stop_codon:yes gene_type:complete